MQPGSLLHLPKHIKVAVLVVLGTSFLASVSFVVYCLLDDAVSERLFGPAVSMLQFTATGGALALIALYSTKTISSGELLRQTTIFLTEEMPRAFRAAVSVSESDVNRWSTKRCVDDVCTTTIKIDHVRDSPSASYFIEGAGNKIRMRITLNAFRFVVLYYVPRTNNLLEESVEDAISLVVIGAESVGYTHKVTTNTSPDGSSTFVEIYFYKMVDRDLLLDTSARLYWSQDIAVMTKSMLMQLARHGLFTSSPLASPLSDTRKPPTSIELIGASSL